LIREEACTSAVVEDAFFVRRDEDLRSKCGDLASIRTSEEILEKKE